MSAPADVEVTSDAAGSLSFGAYYNNEWFSGAWVPSQADQFILQALWREGFGGYRSQGGHGYPMRPARLIRGLTLLSRHHSPK